MNALLLAAALFYRAPGEDAAGAGMRIGFALVLAMALAAVLLLYWWVKTPWLRVPLLVLLALLPLAILYGLSLSLQAPGNGLVGA